MILAASVALAACSDKQLLQVHVEVESLDMENRKCSCH
ncbi:hypothetical protein [Acinetobacter phage Ab69]|nr:hypothetical protein [Acinetobacter phage Ab69]